MYDYCEAQELDVDTLIHEAGPAQVEINFNHGDPLSLADQAFLFKRTVRQSAIRHGVYATFMAKPYGGQPGSSMHLHQSIVDTKTGKNLFADAKGEDTELFHAHIAGLQKHLISAMALIAPNVNSYRRFVIWNAAPINTHWAGENRTVGLRGPISGGRIEHRVAGADANPYLVLAAILAGIDYGIENKIDPGEPMATNACDRVDPDLPLTLPRALDAFIASPVLRDYFGDVFVDIYAETKRLEFEKFNQAISIRELEWYL